jgi:hypothetical protein
VVAGLKRLLGNKRAGSIARLESLAIYYSWPSMVNGAGGDITQAIAEFSRFDILIIGGTLESAEHPDHFKSQSIIEGLKPRGTIPGDSSIPMPHGTTVFGYVDLGYFVANPNSVELKARAASWKSMGVDGIFYDCASEGMGVRVPLLKYSAEAARQQGLELFYNSDDLEWVLLNVLQPTDSVLIEPVVYSNGKAWRLKHADAYLSRIIKDHSRVKFYGVGRFEQDANPAEGTLKRWTQQYQDVKEWATKVGLAGVCFTDNNYSVGLVETRLRSFR